MAPAPEVDIMIVYGKRQLAAAIKAVPHDGPVEVQLRRESDDSLIIAYRFDYSQAMSKPEGEAFLAGVHPPAWVMSRRRRCSAKGVWSKNIATWYNLDDRLRRIASRINATPKEAFR
jgi:hypothetical protein